MYIYLPNFYSRKVLWDTLLFGGFPMMADPQVMSWYPPAILLSLIPNGWNIFIVLAYVASSCFTYGYVFSLTNSRVAAGFSGLTFGFSGFMVAHLGHAVIIHATAWIPLIIWSLEMLRRRLSAFWFIAGSAGVALSCMGGHSQIFVYGLILSVCYLTVFGWAAPVGRWRYYAVALAAVFTGIALTAVQILPAAELVGQSTRVSYSFQDFVSHALPPRQALTLIFPLVFGGLRKSGDLPYFGAVNQTELTGYVGLLPLVLAVVGIVTTRRRSLALFWLSTALLSLLLVMGDATPLARITYHVPVINQLRAPARHFLEFSFAISVLAGLGVAALSNRQVSMRGMLRIVVFAVLAILGCLCLLLLNSDYMTALAAKQGISRLPLVPWANRSVGIPLIIFLFGLVTLIFWFKQPKSYLRCALLVALLVIDLASFNWSYEWRHESQDKNSLIPTVESERYRNLLQPEHQRLMSYRGPRSGLDETPSRGPRGGLDEMPPNLTRLWGVPNAGGYNVLILGRVTRLLPMIDSIDSPLPWRTPEDQSLDIISSRYFFMPRLDLTEEVGGVVWLKNDMQIWLGSGCNQLSRDSFEFELPSPRKATSLALVTRLACSPAIQHGTEVARYHLTDVAGEVHSGNVRAGYESSEWAYDCNNVKPIMQHGQAKIFKDYSASMNGIPCAGHFYVTTLDLDRTADIKTLKLEWVGPDAAMIVEKVSLVDKTTNSSYPLDLTLAGTDRWRFVEQTNTARVYENLRAMPRAWLVSNVSTIDAEKALDAIKTSKLPDGRDFDPRETALVEEPVTLPSSATEGRGTAKVVGVTDTTMEVHTSSKIANFLVTSDVYYPGWQARIDGKDTVLHRANYALRGVVVPAGDHVVFFEYKPRSFQLGALISLLSLLALAAVLVRHFLVSGQAERRRRAH